MKLDVLGHMSEQGGEDDKLRAAWETASQFKKRYMEHKAELDTIRLAAARMQACGGERGGGLQFVRGGVRARGAGSMCLWVCLAKGGWLWGVCKGL